MSLDERSIEEFLTKLDFKRSYPDLVISLIHKSQDIAGELYSYYRRLEQIVNKYIGSIQEYVNVCSESLNFEKTIGSVDGSMVTLKGFGDKWFIVYGVSRVIFPAGVKNLSSPEISVGVHTEFLGSDDPTTIKRKAIIKMMYGESKAIRFLANTSARKGIIFIDGPMIDPPNIKDHNYIEWRVDTFRTVKMFDSEIIGVVKRYSSQIFIGELLNKISDLQIYNDRFFVPLVFNKLRALNNIPPNVSLYSKPIRLRREFEIAINPNVFDAYEAMLGDYESGESYYIYGMYFQYALGIRTVKIEFLARDFDEAEQKSKWIAALLRSIMIPGTYLPLPILLAHETSLIRKRVAKVILSNALSRFISGVTDFNIVYDLMTYE